MTDIEKPGTSQTSLEDYVEGVMNKHSVRNGLCDWCACEWPCDAYVLAEHIDDHFIERAKPVEAS